MAHLNRNSRPKLSPTKALYAQTRSSVGYFSSAGRRVSGGSGNWVGRTGGRARTNASGHENFRLAQTKFAEEIAAQAEDRVESEDLILRLR